MIAGASFAALNEDESDGSDDGDEVEREVEEVGDECSGGKFRERPKGGGRRLTGFGGKGFRRR